MTTETYTPAQINSLYENLLSNEQHRSFDEADYRWVATDGRSNNGREAFFVVAYTYQSDPYDQATSYTRYKVCTVNLTAPLLGAIESFTQVYGTQAEAEAVVNQYLAR